MGNNGFFGIGISELVMIAIIALVVLGPERLPSTMRSVAKFLQQVRAMYNELTSQFSEELKPFQDLNPQKLLQEFTDQLTEEDTTKTKPVTPQPTSVKPNPAAIPAKTVTQPIAAAPAPPPAAISNNDASAPTGQPVSNSENQPTPVGDGVVER